MAEVLLMVRTTPHSWAYVTREVQSDIVDASYLASLYVGRLLKEAKVQPDLIMEYTTELRQKFLSDKIVAVYNPQTGEYMCDLICAQFNIPACR